MGFYMTKQSNRNDYNLCEYIADTVEDVSNVPTTATPGSTLLVIRGSRVFILNTNKEWEEME